MKYWKYAIWAIAGAFAVWVLYVVARLGNVWVSVGIVAFALLIALINRLTRKPAHRTGQPTPERRVISTDQDRWGGGGSF